MVLGDGQMDNVYISQGSKLFEIGEAQWQLVPGCLGCLMFRGKSKMCPRNETKNAQINAKALWTFWRKGILIKYGRIQIYFEDEKGNMQYALYIYIYKNIKVNIYIYLSLSLHRHLHWWDWPRARGEQRSHPTNGEAKSALNKGYIHIYICMMMIWYMRMNCLTLGSWNAHGYGKVKRMLIPTANIGVSSPIYLRTSSTFLPLSIWGRVQYLLEHRILGMNTHLPASLW